MKHSKTLIYLALLMPSLSGAQDVPGASLGPEVRVHTNRGAFVMHLNRERAPMTVENFMNYVAEGHYEGTIFHRVILGFLAQAGGYTTDMQVKPMSRAVVNESGNGLSNTRGTVGLARTNDPHSGNAQFYINLVDNIELNPRPTRWGYTVFGEVVEGMEVVDDIGYTPTGPAGEFVEHVPVDPIIIERVEVLSE